MSDFAYRIANKLFVEEVVPQIPSFGFIMLYLLPRRP